MRDYFKLLTGWTSPVTITEEGEVRQARAFIQPVSVLDPERPGEPTAAGTADKRRYLLMAEREAIKTGRGRISVRLGEREFEVLRCEFLEGSHWEGIMREKAGGGHA